MTATKQISKQTNTLYTKSAIKKDFDDPFVIDVCAICRTSVDQKLIQYMIDNTYRKGINVYFTEHIRRAKTTTTIILHSR